MSIKVKFGKQILGVIAANYTLRALFVFSNWIKILGKMECFSTGWLLACSPSFSRWLAAQTCWEGIFCLIPAFCVTGEPEPLPWWGCFSCQPLVNPITSGTLKSSWREWRCSILILLLLETRNCKWSLPADRWFHKSRPSAANYGRKKIQAAEFSVCLLKISKGVTVFPDHKAIHSITWLEPVNYLNNLKPRTARSIYQKSGFVPVCSHSSVWAHWC